jgi:hypothetical protein
MVMGERGMADMGEMEMPLPDNTLPMMTGQGPYGAVEMGGMFTVLKVRAEQKAGDYADPGWYKQPPGTVLTNGPGPLLSRRARKPRGAIHAGDGASPQQPKCRSESPVRIRVTESHSR